MAQLRRMRGLLLAVSVLIASSFPLVGTGSESEQRLRLVVAGCENEQHLKKAEQLIEQTRKENWDRTKWETECRKAGFEVVGDERVVYLIPIYYTPAFVDRLFSLFGELLKQPAPIARIDELEPALQEALLALSYRPSVSLQITGEPSGERLRAMLSNGEMLIGFTHTWWFFAEEERGSEFEDLMMRSKRSDDYYTSAFERLFSITPSSPPTPLRRVDLSKVSLRRWHFLFSTSLSVQTQVEQMQAYLQELRSLQAQVVGQMLNTMEQMWERLYPEQSRPGVGGIYTLEELFALAEQLNLEFTPPEPEFAPKEWRFREWRIDIEFMVRDGSGTGIRSKAIPLEVLLGL